MSDSPKIVQRPETFKEWFGRKYPDCHYRPHVGEEVWFTGKINDTPDDMIERMGHAFSEYLDEQLTKEVN